MNPGNALLSALCGTGFLFAMTTLGASAVFLVPVRAGETARRLFDGFAAGVMLAASVWSLLTPAIAAAESLGIPGWLPAGGGLITGVLFLLSADLWAQRFRRGHQGRGELLQLAMTLHNIPEGMAVGLSFALAAEDPAMTASSMALALGIGIQNLPEGAAISLPLPKAGYSKPRAFLHGMLSGSVEPLFGVLSVFAAARITALMPWLLSFAAGAMLYVVAEELIPAAKGPEDSGTCSGTLAVMTGFLVMMVLDVALG